MVVAPTDKCRQVLVCYLREISCGLPRHQRSSPDKRPLIRATRWEESLRPSPSSPFSFAASQSWLGESSRHCSQSHSEYQQMRKPISCESEGEHRARFRVWMKNGEPKTISSNFNCFVPMIDWERRWRKFENGDEPICVCEEAARQMGIVR